jgi:hypothetical protein
VLRGDFSNLLLALYATSKRPLKYLLSFLGGISPRSFWVARVLFTASAWPEQVLSGADRRDREGQVLEEEQVRREPAPQFPLEGVEDYESRRNSCAGKFTLGSSK